MDIRNKLFPYPVLSSYADDYVGCSFEADAEVKKEGSNLHFIFTAVLDNPELLSMIDAGKANIVFHLECAQTGFRFAVETNESSTERTFTDDRIAGRLKICPFIVAVADIPNFVNASFNDDYRGFKFQIEAGCVLAIGKQINFDIEKEKNDLSKAKSIFSIIRNADPAATEMEIELSTKKIVIKLPVNEWLKYWNLEKNPDLTDTLNSLVIVPALVYTLDEINKSSDRYVDFGSNGWYKSIKRALADNFQRDIETTDFDSGETFIYAQKLVKSPFAKTLSYLYVDTSGEEDDEE